MIVPPSGLVQPFRERVRSRAVRWRTEPFRPFFPLGVVLGWVGIGHWLLYTTGVTATYSCQLGYSFKKTLSQ